MEMSSKEKERVENALNRLAKSPFRAKFSLKAKDLKYVEDKGMETIQKHACDFIQSRLAPANPKNDGKQTPMKNHPVFIAQHATATCCRGCLEKWHKIPKDRQLSSQEIDFVVKLIMTWIEKQIKNFAKPKL